MYFKAYACILALTSVTVVWQIIDAVIHSYFNLF